MPKKPKLPVTERALLGRVNRDLKYADEIVKRCRPDTRGADAFGRFFQVSTKTGKLVKQDLDLEKLARDLGVMHDWETMIDDPPRTGGA